MTDSAASATARRCQSKFTTWFDGHAHVVQCQQDEGHESELHTHERRWDDAEAEEARSVDHSDLFCQRCGALGSRCRCAEDEHLEAERREQANLYETVVQHGGSL